MTAPDTCQPGAVIKISGGFGVYAGDGVLAVYEVQLEGKRAMSAGEFLRGQRGLVGDVMG